MNVALVTLFSPSHFTFGFARSDTQRAQRTPLLLDGYPPESPPTTRTPHRSSVWSLGAQACKLTRRQAVTMSLAFLFKKTWHPSTLQNSERVWIAEQKDAAEKKRIEELTKQVREEQQVRELEEMQVRRW